MTIQPIVEGFGEVNAVPILLRRLMQEGQIYGFDVGRPIRRKRDAVGARGPSLRFDSLGASQTGM